MKINKEAREPLNIKFSNYFKCVIEKITECIKKFWFLSYIIYASCCLYFACYPLFISTNLVDTDLSIKNPIEYFKLKRRINISYITNYYNISNLTIINETYGSAENFINNKLNFTSINGGIGFESEVKNFKILSTISLILYIFNLMLFFSLFFNINFKIINDSHCLFLLIVISVLFIISIILYSCILKIVNRLDNSLNSYYVLIQRLFRYGIAQRKIREFFKLGKSYFHIHMHFFMIIVIFVVIIFFCNESIQYRVFNQHNYLRKLIEEN